MHRHFRMVVPAEDRRAFQADRPITQRSAFRAASHNADVLGHIQLQIVDFRLQILQCYDMAIALKAQARQILNLKSSI